MSAQEIVRRAFEDRETPIISYGLSFEEACKKHVDTTFKASRVYIISSSSLARNTQALVSLQQALGDKLVGTRVGMKPHTLWSEILEVVHDAREVNADLIITVGGGSLTDGAKVISFALANDVETREDLKSLPQVTTGLQTEDASKAQPSSIPIISVPTSLSGGEYSNYGGSTDDETHVKHQFAPPLKGPSLIILDGALATTTPLSLWLSSGIRAVDHCVDALCSLQRDEEADRAAAQALKLLLPGLLKCKHDANDAEARHLCQLGVNGAMVPLKQMVMVGASHGIGHMLGPMGVGHGETSCILLPAVCKYNAMHNAKAENMYIFARQHMVDCLLWSDDEVKSVLEKRGLKEGEADLGDILDAIVRELGMPRSLKEVNIGRDKFDKLAANSMHDPFMAANPVPITSKEQVLEILDMVAG